MDLVQFEKFCQSKTPPAIHDLDDYFDSLLPLTTKDMIGNWKGGYFPTGSSFDKYLKKRPILQWYGKRFKDENTVNALMMKAGRKVFPVPIMGSAVIRRCEFRGKVSVAMIYNYLPIIDHFRKVDDSTLMGIMTLKERTEVYFYLQRVKEEVVYH